MKPPNPFVGLRPFQSDETIFFFGRRREEIELLDSLHRSRFVAVVGSSGCGKSSLIRAGLIPKLQAGYGVGERNQWVIAVMTPGTSPIQNLATSLLKSVFGRADRARVEAFVNAIRNEGVHGFLGQIETELESRDSNCLLLVDQFEELIKFGVQTDREDHREEAAEFVQVMLGLTAVADSNFYVVMTMRSDFLGECDAFYGLPEAMNHSQYLVPRMTRQQRREAIEGPIHLVGQAISPHLLDRVLNDAGDDSDVLPVMQHAMMRTWEKWNGSGKIDVPDYQAAGTLISALSVDAESAMTGLDVNLTRKIFQALTDTDVNNRRVSRPTALSRLIAITGANSEQISEIIERFIADRRTFLIRTEDELTSDALIRISHEALIRQWSRLRDWVDEEARNRNRYIRLAEDAENHEMLWQNPRLQAALQWRQTEHPNEAWAHRYHKGFSESMRFLDESAAHIARLERMERRRQARSRLIAYAVAAVSILVAIVIWQLYLGVQQQKRVTLAQSLASKARLINVTEPSNVDRAALLAIESINLEPLSQSALEAASVLRQATSVLPAPISQFHLECEPGKATLSSGGRFLACVDNASRSAKMVSVAEGKEISRLAPGDSQEISTVEPSSDGKFLGVGFKRGGFKLFEAQTGKEVISESRGYETTLAFSENGKTFAAAVSNEALSQATVHVLSLADDGVPRHQFHTEYPILALTLSPDGRFFAASHEGRDSVDITIFDIRNGQTKTIGGAAATARPALSEGAAVIAWTRADNTVSVIDTTSKIEYGRLLHQNLAYAVALSMDGKLAASGSEDGTAQVMEVATGRRIALVPAGSSVKAAAFTADNNLVVVSENGIVGTFAVVNRPAFEILPFPGTIGISPRGHYVTTFNRSTATIRIFDRLTKRMLSQWAVPEELVSSGLMRYSSDEKYLVATLREYGATVYDVGTGKEIARKPDVPGVIARAISNDGNTVAWSTAQSILIFAVNANNQQTLEVPRGRLLELSPDGRLIAASTDDRSFRVFDLATKKQIFSIVQEVPVTRTAFSSDGRYVAIRSANRTLTLYELSSRETLWQYEGVDATVLVFSEDGSMLAADGQGLSAVNLYLIGTAHGVATDTIQIPNQVMPIGAAFSKDGRYLDVADSSAITRHYVSPKDLIDQTCSLSTRNLRSDEWDNYMVGVPYRKTCPNIP